MDAPAEGTRLVDLLAGRRIALRAGAGASTDSGIPDYRGPETARRARTPIQGRQFRRPGLGLHEACRVMTQMHTSCV